MPTVALVVSAVRTAEVAILAASVALLAISLMLVENADGTANPPEQREATARALCSSLLAQSCARSLGTVDLATGKVETVARVPGFTRGLDFLGPLAFIGLSQLRETNSFTDIPITEENADRMSGVWIVNLQSGQTIGFLKFSSVVQEIFAVQTLPGMRFPAIVDDDDALIKSTYVLPDAALKEVRFSAPVVDEAAADAD